jgi:hypothetical protein
VDVSQARPGYTAVAELLNDRGMCIHSGQSCISFALDFIICKVILLDFVHHLNYKIVKLHCFAR